MLIMKIFAVLLFLIVLEVSAKIVEGCEDTDDLCEFVTDASRCIKEETKTRCPKACDACPSRCILY